LGSVVWLATIQGIFIALVLDMSVWGELWFKYPGLDPIGYAVFILLATMILLINWVSGCNFARTSAIRGIVLIKELEYDSWRSLCGCLVLCTVCLVLWQALTRYIFNTSPAEVFAALNELLAGYDFLKDVYVSLGEILIGILLSGGLAVVSLHIFDRFPLMKRMTDGLFQASHVAPVAFLPALFGLVIVLDSKWSTMCVVVFTFYPFARGYAGLKNQRPIIRILLAIDEALPYGGTAIVYSEMMNATAGLSFVMVVAGATYQTAKGLVGFVTLVFLVATLSTILRSLAKLVYSAPRCSALSDRPHFTLSASF